MTEFRSGPGRPGAGPGGCLGPRARAWSESEGAGARGRGREAQGEGHGREAQSAGAWSGGWELDRGGEREACVRQGAPATPDPTSLSLTRYKDLVSEPGTQQEGRGTGSLHDFGGLPKVELHPARHDTTEAGQS